jgi:hypothetical protein
MCLFLHNEKGISMKCLAFDQGCLKFLEEEYGANEVIGANYTTTTPFLKPLLIF